MPTETYWFCHQCESQIAPVDNEDGTSTCPNCESDFLERVDAEESDSLSQGGHVDPFEFSDYAGYDDEDPTLDLPGAFPPLSNEPSPPHSPRPSHATPSRSASASSAHVGPNSSSSAPLFRMGFGGGSLTIGGSFSSSSGPTSSNMGRRAGFGAEQASPLRSSHVSGVPTLAEFLTGSFGGPLRGQGQRGRDLPLPPGGGFGAGMGGSLNGGGGQQQPGVNEIMAHLLNILRDPTDARRGGGGYPLDDPYLQLLRGQGGLGAFLGGPGMRGNFGDYATSQEAFDNIVTQLAAAAGPSANRPPPATNAMIQGLPTIPIENVLLAGLDQKDCTICMSDFEPGETGVKMPCTHLFHKHCLTMWLETNGTCPVCRYSLVSGGMGGAGVEEPAAREGEREELPRSPPRAERQAAPVRQAPLVRRSGAAAGTGVVSAGERPLLPPPPDLD